MVEMLLKLTVGLVFAAVPPLTDDQSARLKGAVDGADYHDEAFLALVEHARTWTPASAPGDAPIRLNPDFAAMIEQPGAYRGDLCRLSGALQQATRLAPPYESITEWFVRGDDGPVVVVYVVGLRPAEAHKAFGAVEIDARFYKRMDFVARDGKPRSYPAFVGAFPRHIASMANPGSSISPMSVLGGLVGVLAIVFIALFLWARRGRSARGEPSLVRHHQTAASAEAQAVDDREHLPDDPAQALAELKRRAGET